jgi:Bacterial regulatory proteins, tetR family/Transcriptional regulator C-terminal region
MKENSPKQTDRRIQKTKKYLTEALIALIFKKGYEQVTIQDIIDKANVGRSTFYFHYENKEQLLLDGHHNLGVNLFPDENLTDEDFNFHDLFLHISENLQLAKAMLGKMGGNIMTGFLKNHIAFRIKKKYNAKFGKNKTQQKMLNYQTDAAASLVMSFLISWIEDDLLFSVEEMTAICQDKVFGVMA